MARPVVALLSDFGTADHYAGTMKGVLLSVCPDVTLVDIAHDLPAHDVMAGALQLAACYRYFPPATIFLVVVDPGVGSARRGIAAEAGDFKFVAPDNGVLSAVFKDTAPRKVVELTERKYARPTISRTFEGRDRFAPAAGWLAKGLALASLGRGVADYQRLDLPDVAFTSGGVDGVVIHIDRFGNCITNIERRDVEKAVPDGALAIAAGSHHIAGIVSTYDEAEGDLPCALYGSSEHLEIAIKAGHAATRLRLDRGAPVRVTRRAPA
jgi:S-adenosylmethionine hydrolase